MVWAAHMGNKKSLDPSGHLAQLAGGDFTIASLRELLVKLHLPGSAVVKFDLEIISWQLLLSHFLEQNWDISAEHLNVSSTKQSQFAV